MELRDCVDREIVLNKLDTYKVWLAMLDNNRLRISKMTVPERENLPWITNTEVWLIANLQLLAEHHAAR